jgi:PEP-CTERM motif
MRRFLLSLAVLLVVASAATGVHASTDCQRWFVEYKNSLAQTNAGKHLLAAKHRAHRYIHRKLAVLHKPKPANKPRVLTARFQRPKMTREEILRRFNLACGDMPEDMPAPQMALEEEPKPDYLASPVHGDMLLENPPDGGLIAANVPPPSSSNGGGYNYPPGFGGGYGGGSPGGLAPKVPAGGGGSTPPTGPPTSPPVSPVPEPGSLVMMLTGIVGAAGMARRRFAR